MKIILNVYFFILFLLTAQPCDFLNITDANETVTIGCVCVFSLLMCLLFKVKCTSKNFIVALVVMSIWSLLQKIIIGRNPSPLVFIEIFIVFVSYSLYKKDLKTRFEHLSVNMALLAIFLWLICLFAYEPMLWLSSHLGAKGATESQSLYIFSVPIRETNRGFLLRNCGYSWEPGRFACMLIVALWFNILRTNLDFKDRNFRILTMALITSQSTTGYVVYIIMIGIYYFKYKKWNPYVIVVLVGIFVSSLSLPFMRDKVLNLFESSQNMETQLQNMDYIVRHGKSQDGFYVPQRFEGFMFQSLNLAESNKIIGDGRNFQNYYINKNLGYPIVVSEGIQNVFIRYGLLIGLFMYFSLFRSSASLCKDSKGRGEYLYAILFIGLSFSYYLWEHPLFMLLWMKDFFEDSLPKMKSVKNKIYNKQYKDENINNYSYL